MSDNLLPRYSTDDSGNQVLAGYFDPWGHEWRQGQGGGWERRIPGTRDYSGDSNLGGGADTWAAGDPNRKIPFDVSPYTPYLEKMYHSMGYGISDNYTDTGNYPTTDPRVVSDPNLFDQALGGDFNPANLGANWNPYASTANRNELRKLAVNLGLPEWAADESALKEAMSHLNTQGQPYSGGTSPIIIGDDIAKMLFERAGRGAEYAGMSEGERRRFVNEAGERQRKAQEHDPASVTDWNDSQELANLVMAVGNYGFGMPTWVNGLVNTGFKYLSPTYASSARGPNWKLPASLAGLFAGSGSIFDGKGGGPQRRIDAPEDYKFSPAMLEDVYKQYEQQQESSHG